MLLHIRPADLTDVPALHAMIHALARHHGDVPRVSQAELHRDLFGPTPCGAALIADRSGQACGYGLMVPLWRAQTGERAIDLHHLYVRPDQRGQGIGRALIAAAATEARARGATRLTIGTDPGNAAAQAFYRHMGLAALPGSGPRFALTL